MNKNNLNLGIIPTLKSSGIVFPVAWQASESFESQERDLATKSPWMMVTPTHAPPSLFEITSKSVLSSTLSSKQFEYCPAHPDLVRPDQ